MVRRTDTRGLDKVVFDLTNARRLGHVIKNNTHTVIVEFIVGTNKRVRIKRHKRKHDVRPVQLKQFHTYTQGPNDVMWESGGGYVE